MKGLPAILSALAATLLAAPRSAADPADDYLVRAEAVPARGMLFISFVPSNGWCSASWQTNRLERWKERVADRVGFVGRTPLRASGVELRGWREPIRAKLDPVQGIPFATWLRKDDTGLGAVSLDGGRTNAVNAFSVSSVDAGQGMCVLSFAPAGGTFELDSSQGAGPDLWLLSRSKLEERWSQRLSAEPDAVRADVWAVKKARGSGPGAKAWGKAMDTFLEKHQAIWPGVRFSNASGVPVKVELLHDGVRIGETGTIPARGDCTNRIDRRVEGDRLEWRAWPADSGLCGDDYGKHSVRIDAGILWSPTVWAEGPGGHLAISVDGTNMKRNAKPRLRLDDKVFPAGALKLLDDKVTIGVVYADGDGKEENCPVLMDRAGLYAEIEPHRELSNVVIRLRGVAGLPPETELAPLRSAAKPHWCCGDSVRLAGRVKWLPWPSVKFRNDGNATVVHEVSLRDADGKDIPGAVLCDAVGKTVPENRIQLDSGATNTFQLVNLPDVPSLSLVVRSSADACDDRTTTFEVVRGKKLGTLAPKLNPKTYPWPLKDSVRWLPVIESEKAFREYRPGSTFKALRTDDERRNFLEFNIYATATNLLADVRAFSKPLARPDDPNTAMGDWYKGGEVAGTRGSHPNPSGQFAVSSADVFAVVREHLNTCLGGENCPCKAFRAERGGWLDPAGRTTPDNGIYMALYEDWMMNAKSNQGKKREDKASAVEKRARILGLERKNGGTQE